MPKEPKKTFEDCVETVEEAIRKQRSRWRLDCISWFDFEDVEQVIKLHIYNKWSMWDQKRPLEPWINIIVTNQIRNLVRNHYGNYIKPCVNCPHNDLDNGCSFTKSGLQDHECPDFRKWAKTKKPAFDLKVAVSTEEHVYEIGNNKDKNICFDSSIEKLNEHMKSQLSKVHYIAYEMLFFQDCSEEDVAEFMGYKTNEKKRKAGYRQVKNLKKLFAKKASEIIKNNDILLNHDDL
jgi:DNA-directed RNA polymerase specialized sigma24 family protein